MQAQATHGSCHHMTPRSNELAPDSEEHYVDDRKVTLHHLLIGSDVTFISCHSDSVGCLDTHDQGLLLLSIILWLRDRGALGSGGWIRALSDGKTWFWLDSWVAMLMVRLRSNRSCSINVVELYPKFATLPSVWTMFIQIWKEARERICFNLNQVNVTYCQI